MADTTVYIINSTDNSTNFAIQPRTYDGPGGVQTSSDLTLYGNAAANWGERFNENFYRLLENFACEDKAHPAVSGVPKDESDIGVSGLGINNPIPGQLWFNKTNDKLYVYDVSETWQAASANEIADIAGLQTALDEKVDLAGDTMTGFLTLHADPTSNLHAATKQYVDQEVDPRVLRAGDMMTGFLTLHADPTSSLHAATKQYVDDTVGSGAGSYVLKSGDTMTGPLEMDISTGNTKALHIQTTSGGHIQVESTGLSSAPPGVILYNADNDPDVDPSPAGTHPYTIITQRDSDILSIEANQDDVGMPDGSTNQLTVLRVYQTGLLRFFGGTGDSGETPVPSPVNTIRCDNASVADVAAHPKNLTTREYVESVVGFIQEEGSVLLPNGQVSAAVYFSNTYSVAALTLGFDDGSLNPPGDTGDTPYGFARWIKSGGNIIGFRYTFGSSDVGHTETAQWSVMGLPV